MYKSIVCTNCMTLSDWLTNLNYYAFLARLDWFWNHYTHEHLYLKGKLICKVDLESSFQNLISQNVIARRVQIYK